MAMTLKMTLEGKVMMAAEHSCFSWTYKELTFGTNPEIFTLDASSRADLHGTESRATTEAGRATQDSTKQTSPRMAPGRLRVGDVKWKDGMETGFRQGS